MKRLSSRSFGKKLGLACSSARKPFAGVEAMNTWHWLNFVIWVMSLRSRSQNLLNNEAAMTISSAGTRDHI